MSDNAKDKNIYTISGRCISKDTKTDEPILDPNNPKDHLFLEFALSFREKVKDLNKKELSDVINKMIDYNIAHEAYETDEEE